MHLVTVT